MKATIYKMGKIAKQNNETKDKLIQHLCYFMKNAAGTIQRN